jgi:glutamate synthase domain-containing protein 1
MCGIAGVAFKKKDEVGRKLSEMLEQLQHRGTDSAGYAIYGGLNLGENEYVITVEALKNRNLIYGAIDSEIKSQEELSSEILRYTIFSSSHEHVMKIAERLNGIEGIKVLGAGKYEMIKDLGTVAEIDKKFRISEKKGTHGLGHVRFSTESSVDRYHAHPFQSYLYPDTTVVHNGQITNVFKLRRKLESKGHRFSTTNDTEVIVHYIADKLLGGYSLKDALHESVREMDGPFTYIIATPDEIGIVKDKLALRPGTIYEGKNVLAVASEKVALEAITSSQDIGVLSAGEVRTFKVN